MALQDSSVNKAIADSRLDYDYDSSIMNAIQAEIAAAIIESPPRYDIYIEYNINGREVTQPDTSTIDCDRMVTMIRAKGYTVGITIKHGVVKFHIRIE